jgi:hypothetical protein
VVLAADEPDLGRGDVPSELSRQDALQDRDIRLG